MDGFSMNKARLEVVRSDVQAFGTAATNQNDVDIARLLRTLWRGKLWVALSALIAGILGVIYAVSIAKPVYTSYAYVAFESRDNGQIVDFSSAAGGLALGGSSNAAVINTEVEVLRSRSLMEKLVTKLDLVSDAEFNPQLIEVSPWAPKQIVGNALALLSGGADDRPWTDEEIRAKVVDNTMDSFAISSIPQTFVLRILVSGEDPAKTSRMANALADLYILDQLEVKFEATERATAWLTERVSELKVQLEQAVEKVKVFNASSQLISPETLAALNRQIKDLRDREQDANEAITTTGTRLQALKEAKDSGDVTQMAQVADDRTLTRLLQLIQDGAVEDQTAFDTRYDQIIARAELEVSRAQSQVDAFTTSIAQLEEQVANQSEDLVTLQQLEREAEASRLIYEYFLNRLKETSVQQGIHQADARVLSKAVVPSGPSAPRKAVIVAMALILGGSFGAALLVARELMQNTFRSAEELEKSTGYAVMGQIPVIPARKRNKVLQYLTDKPTSAAAESIRNLRTSTLLSNVDKPPQIIMSTSSIPGEGKTTQSLALAHNLSGLGKKVLLIEGDIRRRVFAEYFDITEKRGLLAVLSGDAKPEDVVIHNSVLGADVMIGEKSGTNAADIFSSEAFRRFLEDARHLYDYVVIDTPPVLVVPDARVIGQLVDAILYTVRWDHTTHRQVMEGLRSFEDVNLRVSGLVLGQISSKGMKSYGYGDSIGAYGNYTKGYYDN